MAKKFNEIKNLVLINHSSVWVSCVLARRSLLGLKKYDFIMTLLIIQKNVIKSCT